MVDLKRCLTCQHDLDVSMFDKLTNSCQRCRRQLNEARISNTYISYLSNLISQSRSANKRTKNARNLEWDITLDDLIFKWKKQEGRCAISGVYLTHHKDGMGRKECNVSLDRISGERGYTVQNVQLVCFRINIMKHTLSEDMFYWWVKNIHSFSCD